MKIDQVEGRRSCRVKFRKKGAFHDEPDQHGQKRYCNSL